MIFVGYLSSALYGAFCLALAFFVFKMGVPKPLTRKLVHILVGAEWFILYHTVGTGVHFLAVCIAFTVLLALVYKFKAMPMISSDGDNSPGTLYYGISMTVMALVSIFVYDYAYAFGIAVLCTSFGDGLAGVFGAYIKKCNPKLIGNKTLIGFLSAFFFSSISTFIFSISYSLKLSVAECVMIGILASGIELVCVKGLDNIAIPLSTSLFAYAFLNFSDIYLYVVPILLTPFVICVVLSRRLLTAKGVAMAVILDLAVSASLGNFGFVLLLSFLLLSVLTDKMKKRVKGRDEISKKDGKRDEVQVFANGFIPAILALLYLFTKNYVFIIGYNVALAECLADTFASSFGVFSKKTFDFFKLKSVPMGLSGGVSVTGTLAALMSPFAFLLISVCFGAMDWKWLLFCGTFAFIGTFIDTLLGSLIQAKYKCEVCGILTEKEIHCDHGTSLVSGSHLVDNDCVNLISCFASAISAMIVFILIS